MSSNVSSTSDQGLLDVINDAFPGCTANQKFLTWASSAGMKSVKKDTSCGTGYFKSTSAEPAGLNGNLLYDVCIKEGDNGAPMSTDLLNDLMRCTSPSSSSGPKKLTWWHWLLIAIAILVGIIIGLFFGYKWMSKKE